MKKFENINDAFQKAATKIKSRKPGKPAPTPPLAVNPFEDYFNRINNRGYKYFEAPDTQTYIGELDKTIALFVQGLPEALADDCDKGYTWRGMASYTVDLPGHLKMFANDGEYYFNKPGKPVSGFLTYKDLRQSEGIKSLLRLAEDANIDIEFSFHFEHGVASSVDIREGSGKRHGHQSPALIVSFDFNQPYDAAKYPLGGKSSARPSFEL